MPLGIFGERGANIIIQLDKPQGLYYPGDQLHVVIALQGEKDLRIKKLWAGLLAWEQIITRDSDGDRRAWNTINEYVARDTLLEDAQISSGTYRSFHLDWQIPADAFPNYRSNNIHSGWQVEACAEISMQSDIVERITLPLVVPPPGERTQTGEYGESSHPESVPMRLELPRLEWVEGEEINGHLIVEPIEEIDVSEVKVQFVHKEHGHGGRVSTSLTNTIERLKIAGKTHFQAGMRREFPFNLPIPARGLPIRSTGSTTVSYELQGVLSRRMRKDYTVSAQIWLYSCSLPG